MKMKSFIYGLILYGTGMLAACTTYYTYTSGTNFDDGNVNRLEVGVTSTKDVIDLFGDPYKKGKINEHEVYIYYYEKNEIPKKDKLELQVNRDYKTLYIEFGEDGKVKNFTYNLPQGLSSLQGMMMHEQKKQREQERANEEANN
jgi:outer membrane protein assembly factor BamE (lipoprotein component of BamABCDE complex)